jgi:hypothetical protein
LRFDFSSFAHSGAARAADTSYTLTPLSSRSLMALSSSDAIPSDTSRVRPFGRDATREMRTASHRAAAAASAQFF